MSTVSSKLEVFQKALPLVGAGIPFSLDDQTPEAKAANAIYETMVGAALELHAWSFSTKEAVLTYQGETGSLPAYAYTLPPDVMTPRTVLKSGMRFRNYEIRGGKLLCNLFEATDLTMIYTWRAPESAWTAMFTKAMFTELAAYLANGLLDRPEQGEMLDKKAEKLLRRAKRNNRATFQGADANPEPSLIAAWKGTLGQRSAQGLAAIDIATHT